MTSPIAALGLTPQAAGTYAAAPLTTASTGSTTSTSSGTSSSANSASGALLDPQAFLQLLVAQLKYQDPSNPVDTSSFMNQTAMLSQVQTMNSMGSTLTALADAQQAQSATSLIGKQVTYLDANGARVSGVVSAASLQASGATLTVGSDPSVALSSVVQVSAAPTTTTTSTPPTT